MTDQTDTVDALAAIDAGSRLDALRRRRPETRDQIQASSDALFSPLDETEVSLAERLLVAAFATTIAGEIGTARHYSALAHEADAARATVVLALAGGAATTGPYGSYTEAGLQDENRPGPVFVVGDDDRAALGARLSAALEHTHLLVFRPREASAAALDALLEAGWSTDGIVTLSQLVAYIAFQQRVVAGLLVLAEEAAA